MKYLTALIFLSLNTFASVIPDHVGDFDFRSIKLNQSVELTRDRKDQLVYKSLKVSNTGDGCLLTITPSNTVDAFEKTRSAKKVILPKDTIFNRIGLSSSIKPRAYYHCNRKNIFTQTECGLSMRVESQDGLFSADLSCKSTGDFFYKMNDQLIESLYSDLLVIQ